MIIRGNYTCASLEEEKKVDHKIRHDRLYENLKTTHFLLLLIFQR